MVSRASEFNDDALLSEVIARIADRNVGWSRTSIGDRERDLTGGAFNT
jgi:hypothetical protein